MSTINDNQMIYGSWDMECDGQNLCHVMQWQNLCPGYMSCYTNVPKIMIKWSYAKLLLRDKAWQMQFLFFILGYFLPCYPLNNQKKFKLKKNEEKKNHLKVSLFYTCLPKIAITWLMTPKIWCATDLQTDRQTDRKSDI